VTQRFAAGGLDFQRAARNYPRYRFRHNLLRTIERDLGPVAGPGTCAALGVLPQQTERRSQGGWQRLGLWLQPGALFDWAPSTRVGVTYRSKINRTSTARHYTIPVLPARWRR